MPGTVQLVTYNSLTRTGGVRGTFVQVLEPQLHNLLRSILQQVEVDESWYQDRYRDVAAAIEAGDLGTGRDHYVAVGYFEDRLPRLIEVDVEFYLQTYPDVAYALQQGRLDGAQEHFENEGFREGRIPSEGWSL